MIRLFAMEAILLGADRRSSISHRARICHPRAIFLNVLRTVSMLGIIAFGMTAVIISGEIDLSVGAGAALAGCIVAWFSGELSDSIGSVPAIPHRLRGRADPSGAPPAYFLGQDPGSGSTSRPSSPRLHC